MQAIHGIHKPATSLDRRMAYPCLTPMPDTPPNFANLPDSVSASAAPPQTDVYAIHGADPEVLAYAMAKYSRSSLSMKESLAEISSQRAEQFLNTFYFQYGHRSIADLAHIPFAIERLSLLAAIELVDEQRWDGQERSTRYQNFRKSGWYTPQLPPQQAAAYTSAVEALFAAYDHVGAAMLDALKAAIPQPAEMKDADYTRTLKARAFDVARYLLPMATNTSLGQIVSARTLESQISRLLSSQFAEVRTLGERLKSAAAGAAWNVTHAESRVLLEEAASFSMPEAAGRENFHVRLANALVRDVKTAPTLVKYSAPNEYALASRSELRAAAAELMSSQPIEPAPVVDLVEDAGSLEVELATSLLYPECHYSWRQLQRMVAALSAARIAEIVALGTKHRGRHDELPRTFSAGQSFKFDILMDIGGFRDMHRHRRCVQLIQDYTDLHGYEEPTCPGQPSLAAAGLQTTYTAAMDAAFAAYRAAANPPKSPGAPGSSQPHRDDPGITNTAPYLLPLGTRIRAMFKMDFAEALYISELRSGVAGHFSYRRVAWEMYLAIAKRHPALSAHFRIEDVNSPVDLLKR
jgi:thymidylate synthase ThyX